MLDCELEQLIDNDNVVKIFAQNCDYLGRSEKIERIPIGLDFHTIAYKGDGGWGERGTPLEQEKVLEDLLRGLQPTHLRKPRIFVDFQFSDGLQHGHLKRYLKLGETRQEIFRRLLKTGLVDYSPTFIRRSHLWGKKGGYAFSVSPHSNGLDCHRTWEDLVLGCIVIVKTSVLDPLYEGLPVIIINDWDEITQENLSKWLDLHKDAFTNSSYRKKLLGEYWWNKIKRKVQNEGR